MSQGQLSQLSGVSFGSLKRFEQTGEISLSSLVLIADALGCGGDFDALFAPPGTVDVRAALHTIETFIDSRSVV